MDEIDITTIQKLRRIAIDEQPGEDNGIGQFYQLRHGDKEYRIVIICTRPGNRPQPETTGGVVL
jgi:hypothetical protein